MANPALVQSMDSHDSVMATDKKSIATLQSSQLGEHPWLQFLSLTPAVAKTYA
jgi:hypothetical protein